MKSVRLLRSIGKRLASGSPVSVGRFHSPIVDALWALRSAESDQAPRSGTAEAKPEPVAKPVEASQTSVNYDFGTNSMLSEHYRNPYGNVRIGRVLEDLDALAGTIAFKHTRPRAPKHLMLVTASVDRISLLHNCTTDHDMRLSGSVAWVGRSSMVIKLEAYSDGVRGGREPWLEADFTFVARDPETLKSAPIDPLELCTDEERETAARVAAKVERDRAQRNAPDCAQASAEATAALIALAQPSVLMPALSDPTTVLMSETKQSNAFICQPQHRNTQDRIFGGLLMRRSYELAFATAFLFAGARPQFIEVDRVQFLSPVKVGDLLKLESRVLYTTPKRTSRNGARAVIVRPPEVHVEVLTHVVRPGERCAKHVNTTMMTFALPEAEAVKRVLPSSTDEARRMLTRMGEDAQQDTEREATIS